jgi:Uma2 family endonuclease
MATAPTFPAVSVEEYLNTSYEHDVEFVDGVLVDRGMPTPAHAALQAIISEHLRKHRKQFGYGVLPECRVELVKRSRYRIPDVLICSLPIPKTKVLETVPLAVIEIWSPDDRLGAQMARFREYWMRGVRQIVVLDPEEYLTFRYTEGSLQEGAIEAIELPEGRMLPFSSQDLLNELKDELERQA